MMLFLWGVAMGGLVSYMLTTVHLDATYQAELAKMNKEGEK